MPLYVCVGNHRFYHNGQGRQSTHTCSQGYFEDEVCTYVCIPTKNTLAIKKLQPRPEKGCDEKDVKSKGGGQGLCRNAVDHIKNFDIDDSGASMFCGLGQNF